MKKVININLGGFPHVIDDDAYLLLEKYLNSLKRHFKGSQGYENIIQDIEVRMSELLAESRGTRKIIEIKDVQEAIDVMGRPEQLGEEEPGYSETFDDEQGHHHHYGGSRRLFRDGDNKVIAGVCSGLSNYFGIEDPLWIRLGFAISFFGMGFGLLPYLILWIAVPTAKTSAEKLAMHGEPVNINSIANKIQDDLSDLTQRINNLGDELRGK
jgi:phage shock protein PspC (stress-responsive transcriptional regulator)